MFDGNTSRHHMSLAGSGRGRQRPGGENRSEFLKRQHKERDEREQKRIRERAALKIQAYFRGWRGRKATSVAHRALFDKRCGDVAKVEKLLQPAQRAAFVLKAILSVLRLIAFFFTTREDKGRLSTLLEMIYFSAVQQAPHNFFQMAFADDPDRMGFLVLLEKLISALLSVGQVGDVARLLQLFRAVLFANQSPSPNDCAKQSFAIRHVLCRTAAVPALSAEDLFLKQSSSHEEQARAIDVALFLLSGLDACSEGLERKQLLAYVLSAPQLWAQLSGETPDGVPHECLRRLVGLVPAAPEASEAPSLAMALHEEVGGSARWVWLLGSFAVALKRLLQAQCIASEQVQTWLVWICWVKEAAPAGVRGGAYASQLSLLHSTSFASALCGRVDLQDSAGLLNSILELYFPSASGGLAEVGGAVAEEAEPAPEALQALAFGTPLTQRIFPSLIPLTRSPSISTVFDDLGLGGVVTPLGARLFAFCAVYRVQLQSMYDAEFFGHGNPLRPEEIASFVPVLNHLAYRLVVHRPDRGALPAKSRAIRAALTALVRALYHRHLRKPIVQATAGGDPWMIPEARQLLHRAPIVDLGTDASPVQDAQDDDEAADMEDDTPQPTVASPPVRRPARLGGDSHTREVLEAVLEEVPHVLPFEDRVALLHNVISLDQENREESRAPWARSELRQHQIRRNFLVEDGFAAFASLDNEDSLREVFKVEFIAPDGSPESGIDGGGLFKEFMIHICRETFDPKYGLFTTTDDQTLYPSPSAFRVHGNAAADLYRFLGKVTGKAIYEMFLLEAQFSRVFLNRILGRTNEVDDVAALDKELHRNMLRIKEQPNVEDMCLTFSINTQTLGHSEDVDLIPNGRNIAVTKENLTQYLHVVSNFRTNLQIQRHTTAFVQGLQCVLPLSWLKMFDPYELNTLISGSSQGFDVADLRQHTVYGGGYREDSPVVQWLWMLIESFDVDDMGRFLMFTTSCSRPPLLGFKTLYPQFGVHRVPDATRLPTASTCANLLKLPDYRSFDELKAKLTEAIRSECGFDLS